MYFEVYRAPFVRLTSTLSGGGDWRWRFCRPGGIVVAASQGYPTETECRHSIAMLACGAANAVVRDVFSHRCGREAGSVVRPAEIGPRLVLTLIGEAAPDRPRARKQVEQRHPHV